MVRVATSGLGTIEPRRLNMRRIRAFAPQVANVHIYSEIPTILLLPRPKDLRRICSEAVRTTRNEPVQL